MDELKFRQHFDTVQRALGRLGDQIKYQTCYELDTSLVLGKLTAAKFFIEKMIEMVLEGD